VDHEGWDFFYGAEQFFSWYGNDLSKYFLMLFLVFGAWNMFSFSVCAGLGYLFLGVFQTIAKRTVHKMDLHNNL
jgi:hypothetical protein